MKLFSCSGGHILLPNKNLVLVSRMDGGNLVVIPPREVWDRSELTPQELIAWSFLVAATGKAMLQMLPQLESGCVNYWDAGNWALNEQAEPVGLKTGKFHRKVHVHLCGRSRTSNDASWKWGESPKFPDYADRFSWASKNARLNSDECGNIVSKAETILKETYAIPASQMVPWRKCLGCGYPRPSMQPEVLEPCAVCA